MNSLKELKPVIVKNSHSENVACDANMMAQLENQRSLKQQTQKKSRFQSFISNTKLNASKIYKEKQQKVIDSVIDKKNMAEKQKQVKAKYTVVEKKMEKTREIDVKPTKIDWKKSEKGITIPTNDHRPNCESEDDCSAIDSEFEEKPKIQTPIDLLKERQSIRNKMLNKMKMSKQ